MITMTKQQVAAIRVKAVISNEDPDELLARAEPTIGCNGAVAVRWAGMWLCVEADGYVHT